MIPLTIPDLESLQASYLPFVNGGAIFVPSNLKVVLGETKLVMITFPGVPKAPVTGKVVWINPRSVGMRPQGFAIQLDGQAGIRFKNEFEKLLAGRMSMQKPTFTF